MKAEERLSKRIKTFIYLWRLVCWKFGKIMSTQAGSLKSQLKPSFTKTPSNLYNRSTQILRFKISYTNIRTQTCQTSMLIWLWQHMCTKITMHLIAPCNKNVHIKIYTAKHPSSRFYTSFSLVQVGLQQLAKAYVEKTLRYSSCIEGKKTYHLMTFPPTIESRNRKKENQNKTFVSSQITWAGEASFTC